MKAFILAFPPCGLRRSLLQELHFTIVVALPKVV